MKMDQKFHKNRPTIDNAHEAFFRRNIQMVYRRERGFQTIKIPHEYSTAFNQD